MKRIIDLIPIEVKHLNIGLSLESPLKPYERMKFTSIERMKFTSIEDAKNDYTRYAKIKGFSFCMGCITKSRTNGMIIGQEIVCSKEKSQAKKYAERENRSLVTPYETRVSYKAMLYMKKKKDRWINSRFIRDHNHKIIFLEKFTVRVYRTKTNVQKKLIVKHVGSKVHKSSSTSISLFCTLIFFLCTSRNWELLH